MKSSTVVPALLVAMLSSLLALGPAVAAPTPPAVTTADVNLRAGPGTQYPVVTTIPYGAGVVVAGCVSGFAWCDVIWGGERGWVAAAYLQVVYRGAPVVLTARSAPPIGINVVVFDHAYWSRYYVGRPWYRNWHVYVVR